MGEKHTSAATGSDKRSYKRVVLKCAKIVANIVGYTLDITGTGELYTTLGLLLIKLCIKAALSSAIHYFSLSQNILLIRLRLKNMGRFHVRSHRHKPLLGVLTMSLYG